MSSTPGPVPNLAPVLEIHGLNVYYGASHALQGVELRLASGVLSVVGRNGMGKTTLCNAIMGLVESTGSICFMGQEIRGLAPAEVAQLGIGYVPQGRRLWRSLTVDEHLRMVSGPRRGLATGRRRAAVLDSGAEGHRRSATVGSWSAERIYATFPRLAERKNNGGAQLSGGEQQMLAIARALLLNPRLLIMDEPTEGLAPVIVDQVERMLIQLAAEGKMDVLVIEQNIGVATAVSEQVAIMVNGQVSRLEDSARLAADRDLQQRLLGVGRHAHDDDLEAEAAAAPGDPVTEAGAGVSALRASVVYLSNPVVPNRWSRPVPARLIEQSARTRSGAGAYAVGMSGTDTGAVPLAVQRHVRPVVLVAGTLDTKGAELRYIRDRLQAHGLAVQLVDLSTSGAHAGADVPASQVAAFHPRGTSGVFTGDRGHSVAGMTLAFERWMRQQGDVLGLIGAGGSGGTAMVAPAMRALPFGVPKILISTVASGQVGQYVGPSDIMMLHSVADVQGLNSITREVLGNGAEALAGMVLSRLTQRHGVAGRGGKQTNGVTQQSAVALPALGISMFGVTTACVTELTKALAEQYDCLVFHATGTGGQAMESLLDNGRLAAVLDITTTEVCDRLMGGVFPAHEDRFGAMIRTRLPYVGACGALDMVNFAGPGTVPEHYKGRTFYEHNPNITLMRTTPEENTAIGQWIGERLNRMEGAVRFFLPEGGVSALDAPGMAFYDPAADRALFEALERTVRQTRQRQLVRSKHHINDPAFVAEVLAAFEVVGGPARSPRRRLLA